MKHFSTKSQRLANYREAKELCERELQLLNRLIEEGESEATESQDGDLLAWIDIFEQGMNNDEAPSFGDVRDE